MSASLTGKALATPNSQRLGSLAVLAVATLVACADEESALPGPGTAGSNSGAGRIQCTYAYRARNEPMDGQTGDEPAFQFQERLLSVAANESADQLLGELTLSVRYSADPFEGDSFQLSADGAGLRIFSTLFQFSAGLPQNQFSGGHGFTGLMYFTHPSAGGDYQTFCEAQP